MAAGCWPLIVLGVFVRSVLTCAGTDDDGRCASNVTFSIVVAVAVDVAAVTMVASGKTLLRLSIHQLV